MRPRLPLALLLSGCFLLMGAAGAALPSFQKLVDEAAAGSLLSPPAGRYAGPVVIDKPLVVDGRGEVTIDAGGKDSVIVLDTDGATLRNLHLSLSYPW